MVNSGRKGELRTKDFKESSEEIGFKTTLITGGLRELVAQGFLEKVRRGIYKVRAGEQETLEKVSKASKKKSNIFSKFKKKKTFDNQKPDSEILKIK